MLRKELGLFLLILVIGGITAFINPQFVSQVNLTNLANQIGLFGLLAIGLGLVIITGGIDLSVGSMVALLGILFLDVMVERDLGWPLALAVAIFGGTLLGTLHGLLITRLKLQPFVVTLCGLLLYRGIARWYTAELDARLRLWRRQRKPRVARLRAKLAHPPYVYSLYHCRLHRGGVPAPVGFRSFSLRRRQE